MKTPSFFNSNSRTYSHILQVLFFFPTTFRKEKGSLFPGEANSFTFSLHLIMFCLFNEFTPLIFAPFSYIFKIFLITVLFEFLVFPIYKSFLILHLFTSLLCFSEFLVHSHTKFPSMFFYTHGLQFQNIYSLFSCSVDRGWTLG